MKKVVTWLAVISAFVFVIAWGVGGVMILNNDYEDYVWVYVGLVSMVIFLCSLIYLKTTRCPHCGMKNQTSGKYCPYCGEKIK